MPKKFKGENTKAQDAKARKAAAKESADEKKRREEEDTHWKDEDKHGSKKQDRKVQKESRRVEQLERKLANQRMLEEEEAALQSKASGGATAKVTHAQIEETKEQQRREREKLSSGGATGTGPPKGVTEPPPLEQNPNLLELERQREGEVAARSVEEAISVLGGAAKTPVDKNPEKRMKAAFAAFEERELPRLKAENPNLRMSQLKQQLQKEWMKSSDNPMVQQLAHDRDT